MSISLQLVPANENAAARRRAVAIENSLLRFRAEVQPRVRTLARVHPWVADLAASFPALLVALAYPRKDVDAESGLRMAVAGAPLTAIAREMRVPLWLRAFPAQAFAGPIPALPDEPEFRCRIANHFPKSWKLAPRWLEAIALAHEIADSDVALWFAREAPLKVKRPRYARRLPWALDFKLLALFAWHAARQSALVRPAVGNWNPEMKWSAALTAARDWRDYIVTDLTSNTDVATDTWFAPGTIDGYVFIPVMTAEEIDAEAAAMKNCVRTYAADIACNYYRIWSVRRDGERIATLSLTSSNGFLPTIYELSGPANAPVSAEVWIAAHRWTAAQDVSTFSADRFARSSGTHFQQAKWRALWRDYWLAKRRIPAWLSLRGNENALWGL